MAKKSENSQELFEQIKKSGSPIREIANILDSLGATPEKKSKKAAKTH